MNIIIFRYNPNVVNLLEIDDSCNIIIAPLFHNIINEIGINYKNLSDLIILLDDLIMLRIMKIIKKAYLHCKNISTLIYKQLVSSVNSSDMLEFTMLGYSNE